MKAYFDNSATTRCLPEATELMVHLLQEEYGNPSSLHTMGSNAEKYITEAKKKIAKTLKAQEKEIIFTSGGTESDNLAILGAVDANKRAGNHLITTAVEHAAVSATMAHLEELGYEVTYLPVDETGVISLDDLKAACFLEASDLNLISDTSPLIRHAFACFKLLLPLKISIIKSITLHASIRPS